MGNPDASAAQAQPDRLSDLPDCLLHGILSLSSMGGTRLMQTSALSRRWRHVWHGVPRLDISPREFQAATAGAANDVEGWARFNNFVDDLVSTQQGAYLPLDVLRLQVVKAPHPDGYRWVRRCLARYSPVVLDIHSHLETPVKPGQMRLKPLGLGRMSRGTVLRRLTTLRLTGVTLCAGFQHLLAADGCPQLEHLELRDCVVEFREVVTSRTLKSLLVDSASSDMDLAALRLGHVPRIVAPGLASLHLVLLNYYADIWMYEMPSLVEATVMRFTFGRDLPEFPNLTILLLDECDFTRDEPTLLEFFLQNAPNLEKLALQNCKLPRRSKRMTERSKSTKMPYQCLNLEFVEIKHRKNAGVREHQIIEFLLGVSRNLQRTGIVLSEGPEKHWIMQHEQPRVDIIN